MVSIKSELEVERVNLQVEKLAAQQLTKDYQSQLGRLEAELKEQYDKNKKMQTELAMAQERLKHRDDEMALLKSQHEVRINDILDNKQEMEEDAHKLQSQLTEFSVEKMQLIKAHQNQLAYERQLQEQFECR